MLEAELEKELGGLKGDYLEEIKLHNTKTSTINLSMKVDSANRASEVIDSFNAY